MWLFRRLERFHPKKYNEMGRPTLFLRNNIEHNMLFLRFLWRKEYHVTGDPQLICTCKLMRVFFGVYGVIFISTFIIFFASINSPK